jgi:hypothetical protein
MYNKNIYSTKINMYLNVFYNFCEEIKIIETLKII